MDELYDDCYKMYQNDIKILSVDPKSIVEHADPQFILDDMKERSLSKVCLFVF